jgi:hypothetical protein
MASEVSHETTTAAAATLMKGKLYQSSSNKSGNWHITESASDTASQHDIDGAAVVASRSFEANRENNLEAKSEASVESKATIDFLKDDTRDMTFGRRIALSLIDKKWYNPKAGQTADTFEETSGGTRGALSSASSFKHDDFDTMMTNSQPSLEKAWAFFEHVALYRYLVPPDGETKTKKNFFVRVFRKVFMKGDKKLDRAEPGEDDDPTKLYSPIFTPHKQLG